MLIQFPIKNEYFSPAATLECGQTFRFQELHDGYLVYSADKICRLRKNGEQTLVVCEEKDEEYFYNYFDLQTDYSPTVAEAKSLGIPYLTAAAEHGKGIRILRQDKAECIISFIVSQQNNIPRIKNLLSILCVTLGEKKEFCGVDYHTFPTLERLSEQDEDFYRYLGLGYRAKYIKETASRLYQEGFSTLENKSGLDLKKALVKYMGIGNKIADCVSLFAFHDFSAFPVDTWIEKLYHENFGGKETDREKINAFFKDKFGAHAGVFQQYLFYYKRENPNL